MNTTASPFAGNDYISQRFAEKVKATAQIVDVVGDVVELRRKGNNWEGLCPFHPDTNLGNFKVNEKRNVCTCFACGTTLSPVNFVMQYYGVSYTDAIKKLATRYNIYNPNNVHGTPYRPTWQRPARPQPRKKGKPFAFNGASFLEMIGETDLELVEIEGTPIVTFCQTLERVQNPLFYFICHQLKDPEMVQSFHETCNLYQVGTSDGKKYPGTKGWTIYPNINEHGEYLTAKYMAYTYDGHRNKTARYNFDYLHTLEQRAGRTPKDANFCRCLFGLHLLYKYPFAELCIVESEKTALIAQTFCDPRKKIFMATGGKSRLTVEALQPLATAGRCIVLYPDVDATKDWTDFCTRYSQHLKKRGYLTKIIMAKQVAKLYDPTKDAPTSDLADLLLRHWREQMEQQPTAPPPQPGQGN